MIPIKELELISRLKRAKDLAAAGRLELAELEYRRAIKIDSSVSIAHNDLGFVLLSQGRLSEAEQALSQAIRIEPNNIAAYENLARVLYQQGRLELSIKSLEKALLLASTLSPGRQIETAGQVYKESNFKTLYRKLSMAYFEAAEYDEAVCYSELTVRNLGPDSFTQAGQHARMLMALGQLGRANKFLSALTSAWGQILPAKIFLDLAITELERGDFASARIACAKGLEIKDIDRADRRNLRILQMLSLKKLALAEELEIIKRDALDEDSEFCQLSELDEQGYWPLSVLQEALQIFKTVCSESGTAKAV